jgi:hypothetical protein
VASGNERGRDQERDQTGRQRAVESRSPRGVVDFVSVLYVVGGIPFLIAVFLILFLLTGACDQVDSFIPV